MVTKLVIRELMRTPTSSVSFRLWWHLGLGNSDLVTRSKLLLLLKLRHFYFVGGFNSFVRMKLGLILVFVEIAVLDMTCSDKKRLLTLQALSPIDWRIRRVDDVAEENRFRGIITCGVVKTILQLL